MNLVPQAATKKDMSNQRYPQHLRKKRKKQEPIQKIQTRNKQDYRKDKNINTNFGATTQKNNNCGFCGQQNWSTLHKCAANLEECNNCHEMGHLAKVCRSKTKNLSKQRKNYIEETYDDEEESELEEIQQITRIKRVLPDKNDRYVIKMKINGKYQNFTIDTGSPVTILPNNLELHDQKYNSATKRKIPRCEQKRN